MNRLIFFLALSLFGFFECAAQNKNSSIKNLVFEGGGVRGLAYAGAMMEMHDRHLLDSIDRVAGTSAGAIAATLYAVGYTPEEILKITSDIKVKSFADGKWVFIGGTKRLIKNFGWYRGDKFYKWMGKLIEAKTKKENITFQELYELSKRNHQYKQLYLTGTNLTLQKTSILCHETFPNMELRTAVRISMSIPFFFQAVIVNENGKVCSKNEYDKGQVMVDGGITSNFPIQIFDYQKYLDGTNDSTAIKNFETLGLRLDEEYQIAYDNERKGLAPVQIKKMKDFSFAFYNIVLENLNRQQLKEEDWARTISISTGGISPRIKRMPQKDIELLVENGRRGVKNFYSVK